ncbi:MAG: molybdopterin converting factor subunit 1 [Bacillaceae bacterium]|jgi:sulfur-carrier protein|uniref:Molybdopterin synthase sulfur carrier subunit n=2 Tax=Aeribacillus TaxID=1055323 RepID=A0A165Y234_9BACI|nr:MULTISPECIES: molybdopterin converting factor subunit 1 [Aeribacillus]AXI39725.1 molybdopterin converting factor subunit 1 [Bacillaceae bacterium ZC4]REJ19641.1 MAG: molybdopterin converting factor subunit 1 [Bacillaceae bacterium]ASS91278.1 molybdopterin converting factor subunit 1 [Aeribacillus pallidus]KZM55637.1 molybdopterin synthase sulfur carrier subunit [Aeribacillus pallidus]KZN96644.1 molybdopterin synthase sulfur carrier subunit [Aeribacillus pallidus]
MIRILFFAQLKEQLNKKEMTLPYQEITVKQLRERLEKEYSLPALSSVLFAINEEFAAEDDIIRDGDVVALIPPMSGG